VSSAAIFLPEFCSKAALTEVNGRNFENHLLQCTGTTQIDGDSQPYFPMSRVIVGGLTFSTAVTLLVLTAIYVPMATPAGMICAIGQRR
jgi:hypothetical protein